MEDKKLDFIIIPTKVLRCRKIPANVKLLMGVIIELCNSKGHCWASNSYLAEICRVDRMKISKWVKSLVENGFIKREMLEENKRNIYISKRIQSYISNYLHIHKQSQSLGAGSAIKDDFEIESKEWTDKKGKKHKRISIDYGENED